MRVESVEVVPHSLPLLEPFTIAQATQSTTRAALVRCIATDGDRRATGYGECALPMRAKESPEDVVSIIAERRRFLEGASLEDAGAITRLLDEHAFEPPPAARAGLHCALIDALSRATDRPLYTVLAGESVAPTPVVTDVTLPINEAGHFVELARKHYAAGFRIFKIKVGADLASDQRALEALAAVTPDATVRFDANEGFTAEQSLALLRTAKALGVHVDGFEQPCPRDDLDGLRRVREEGGVPVIADESVRSVSDVERLAASGAVDGVNLKVSKAGGLDRCLAIGRAARERGLRIMVGSMLESRVGLTATLHLAAALGGAEWVDLDVAFLLAHDPCAGGMVIDGPRLSLPGAPGLALTA
jgi:L-alanine-DL-glutamate epimerase-like enolase superfamily enzyme